jgi:pimeloyl-ACP methyl ester carboxylesterase
MVLFRKLRMSLVVIAATVLLLAVVTQIGVAAIQRLYPASGRMIAVRGATLHIVELGSHDAPPVVLIHGASANLSALRELGDILAKKYRVVLIDRPGHGWSTRDDLRASTPAAQAAMIDEGLSKLGIARAIVVAHSWGGALATALTLDFPMRVGGLVLLAPVTHPWPGGIAWYNNIASIPVVGPLFAHTLALPVGLLMLSPGARGVFMPQAMPEGYVGNTAIALLLRPREFLANAFDLQTLKEAVRAQAPRYGEIKVPTVVITGDTDHTVSPDIHSRAFAAVVPGAKLVVLPGVGHVVQNAAPERVIEAVNQMSGN